MRKPILLLGLILLLFCASCGKKTESDKEDRVSSEERVDLDQSDDQTGQSEEEKASDHKSSDEEKSDQKAFDGSIESMEELKAYVNDQLKNANTTISFTSESIQPEDVKDINKLSDGYYGCVRKFEYKENLLSDEVKYTLICEVSDNTYVEQFLLSGEKSDQWGSRENELASKCKDILNQMEEELPDQSSDYDKELWIHDYLVSTVTYGFVGQNQNSDNDAYDSYGALIQHTAVCNGYAFAMKLLCDLSGIPCKIVTGSGKGQSHAWNLINLDGNWYHLDATWDDPVPDEENRYLYTYFNVPDEQLSLDHEWDKDSYPKANAHKYNYYQVNDLYCEDYDAFKDKCIELMEEESANQIQLMVGDYTEDQYSSDNMEFLFDYTYRFSKLRYSIHGEAPYVTIVLIFE